MKVELGNFGFSRPEVVEPAQKSVVSQALGNAGANISQAEIAAQRNREAFQRARAANSFAKYQLELEDVGRSVEEDMATGAVSWEKADEEFSTRAGKIQAPLDRLDNSIDRENQQFAVSHVRERTRQSLAPSIFHARQRAGVAQLDEFLDTQGKRAGEPGADVGAINASADGFAANAREYGIPPDVLAAKVRSFKESNWITAARTFAKADPAAALAALAKPNPDDPRIAALDGDKRAALENYAKDQFATQEAGRILEVYRSDARAGAKALTALASSGLDPEVANAVRARVREGEGLLHAERRQELGDEVTALERSITQNNPGANAEAAAASLYRRGAYSAEQYTNALQAIDAARMERARAGVQIASVQEAILNGQLLDPRDKDVVKAVDAWFVDAMNTNHVQPGSDEWVNNASAIAARTNVLPPEAMSWARRSLLSSDPNLSVPAANAITRFSDASPAAYAFFDDPVLKAQAEAIDGMARAGAKPADAVENARKMLFDIPKARLDAFQAEYTKKKFAADNKGDLQSKMNGDDAFETTFFGKAPAPSQRMQDEYNAQVRRYFDLTNGDIDRARSLAWKDMRGTYGISTVNGEPEVLKYAPELVFPGIDPKVIRADIDSIAKQLDVKTPVKLTPTRLTGDTHGVRWQLTTTDEDGYEDVLRDDHNRPRVYAIPTDTETYVRAQDNAKRAAVEAARAESKKRRAIAESMTSGTFMNN